MDMDCIFDQIASGKIPSDVLYQDDAVMAFRDIHPKAPVHVLIIPKKHITSLAEVTPEDFPVVMHMIEVANRVAKQQGIGHGYKLVINTGRDGGQVVMHLHIHLLGGKRMEE
jgi:histidine triad (HIT) family protein